MDRRGFLAGSAALAAIAGSARAGIDGLRAAAREAWIYGLPLIEMAGVRARALGAPAAAGPNVFVHARNLAGPDSRGVTTPNTDTLYSSAWLDLSAGPLTLIVPPARGRYFSLALMDMYTNNFHVIGARSGGGDGGAFTLIGPPLRMGVGDVQIDRPHLPRPPRFMRRSVDIQAPGPWVWALGRTLVAGPEDLAAARAIQDGLAIRAPPVVSQPVVFAGRNAPWNDYFMAVQRLVEDNPPPAEDAEFFHRIAPLQLGAEEGFEKARFADVEVDEVAGGIAEARALLAGPAARQPAVGGWVYPKPDLGVFAQDYLYRAATALTGLASLPADEAMYMRAVPDDQAPHFDSSRHYRLTLPAALPVDGFWSLTLYEVTPEGQLFLTRNPIGRYAIGDRTPGLKRRPDGGLDIWIGRADPLGSHTSNWLPAPAQGSFALMLRAYLPRPELLAGRFRLPAVETLHGRAR